jgi:cysteine desulfurase/selenocysteine lyase
MPEPGERLQGGSEQDAVVVFLQMKARVLRRGLAEQPGVSVHDLGFEQWDRHLPQGRRSAGRDAQPAVRDEHQRPRVPLAARTRARSGGARLDALVRATVHYYNDEPEVERFVRAVAG